MEINSELKSHVLFALQDVPANQVVTVIYYAMRLITNRRVIDNVEDGFMVDLPSEPSSADAEIAIKVIRLIEYDAEKPLQELNDVEAQRYIKMLAEINDETAKASQPINLERGRALLQGLLHRSELSI